jgi:hypothetical protein
MKHEIYQFKITLKNSKPAIWRRFQVVNDLTFSDFHGIIQEVMGWKDYHLWVFQLKYCNILLPDMDKMAYGGKDCHYANEVCLYEEISRVKEKFVYLYDFENDWIHDIVLEKRIPLEEDNGYPLCLDGDMACPPEDCGGILRFYEKLDLLDEKGNAAAKDPLIIEILEEMGDFDPHRFDVETVNRTLRKLQW